MANPINTSELGVRPEAGEMKIQPTNVGPKQESVATPIPEDRIDDAISGVRSALAKEAEALEPDPLLNPDVQFDLAKKRESFRDPSLELQRKALDEFEEILTTGVHPSMRQVEEEGERLFRERQAQKEAEQRKQKAEERRQHEIAQNIQALKDKTAMLTEAQRVRLGVALKILLRDEIPDKGKEVEWPAITGPAKYGNPEGKGNVEYDPRLTFDTVYVPDNGPIEVPREFSMPIKREGERKGEVPPRLVIELDEEGNIADVSLRGYGRAGFDSRVFPQIYISSSDREGVPMPEAPINKLAEYLDEDATEGDYKHHDKKGNYYWSIGVNLDGDLPELYTEHRASKFIGFDSHRSGITRGVELLARTPAWKTKYTYDKESNRFSRPFSSEKQIMPDECEDIMRSMFGLIPIDTGENGSSLRDKYASRISDDPVEMVKLLEKYSASIAEVEQRLPETYRAAYSYGGIDRVKASENMNKGDTSVTEHRKEPEKIQSWEDHKDRIIDSSGSIPIEIAGVEYFWNRLKARSVEIGMTNIGPAIDDRVGPPMAQITLRDRFDLLVGINMEDIGPDLIDPLRDKGLREKFEIALQQRVGEGYTLDSFGRIFRQDVHNNTQREKVCELPRIFTPGENSTGDFRYSPRNTEVKSADEMLNEVTIGTKILQVYLEDLYEINNLPFPKEGIKISPEYVDETKDY